MNASGAVISGGVGVNIQLAPTADTKYKAGVSALADKLQAQTNSAQATLNRVKADGDLKNAQGTLAIAMGLNANTTFILVPIERHYLIRRSYNWLMH